MALTPQGETLRRTLDYRYRELLVHVNTLALAASLEHESVLSERCHAESVRILRALGRYRRFWNGYVERHFGLPH